MMHSMNLALNIGFQGFESDVTQSTQSEDDDPQPSGSKAGSGGRSKLIRSCKVGRPKKVYNTLHFADGNDDVPIPQSFQDAISGEQSGKWKNAMKIEYSALKQNET